MKQARNFAVALLVVAFLVVGAGMAFAAPTPEKPLVIKLSHVFGADTPMHEAVVIAAENLKKRTNGAMEIEIGVNGTLPNGVDGMEQCFRGANFINLYDPSVMADWVPDYVAIMGPFCVETREEFRQLCESPLVLELNKKAEENGFKVLALPFNFGFRNLATVKAQVKSMNDMKGMKLRVPGAQLFIETFKLTGASPVVVPASDVYNAMSTGLTDAHETSIPDMVEMQMQEVDKFVMMTRHFIGTSSAVMSKKVFDTLSPEQQEILIEEMKTAAEYCSKGYADKEAESIEIMKKAGAQFFDIDRAPFIEATKVVYTQKIFPDLSPNIYERIQEELAVIRKK